MKKLIGIVLIAASLTACNNKYKASSEERADSIKMIQDSLKLDSFKRIETAKVEAEAEAKNQPKTTVVNHYSTTETTTPATANKKKGWSSAAKGAVIGGAAGAVGGALIDKKKGRGAAIGGVAGAGAGYLIGRDKDKKSGRVDQ
ncbi:MAG: YMGG-like glycine zipper-containing protein [Pelobium sp.]